LLLLVGAILIVVDVVHSNNGIQGEMKFTSSRSVIFYLLNNNNNKNNEIMQKFQCLLSLTSPFNLKTLSVAVFFNRDICYGKKYQKFFALLKVVL
jgi:hypothetical protein